MGSHRIGVDDKNCIYVKDKFCTPIKKILFETEKILEICIDGYYIDTISFNDLENLLLSITKQIKKKTEMRKILKTLKTLIKHIED
jgi:hypothetical protein